VFKAGFQPAFFYAKNCSGYGAGIFSGNLSVTSARSASFFAISGFKTPGWQRQ
jgi:hypothetical protein